MKKVFMLLSFMLICASSFCAPQDAFSCKIADDYEILQAGIPYKEMVKKYGTPSFVFDVSKGNFFWYEYKINEKETYHFWCGTTENIISFSVISDNTSKDVFYDSRILSESETQEEKIYSIPLGIQKSKVQNLFGEKNLHVDKTGNALVYKISDNEYAKLYFTNSQKLWKISKIINNHERKCCMDIRILE